MREQEEAERIATMTDEEIADQVRAERYRKIAATDYLAMPDYPLCDEDRDVCGRAMPCVGGMSLLWLQITRRTTVVRTG